MAAPDTAATCVRTRRIWPDSPVRAAAWMVIMGTKGLANALMIA